MQTHFPIPLTLFGYCPTLLSVTTAHPQGHPERNICKPSLHQLIIQMHSPHFFISIPAFLFGWIHIAAIPTAVPNYPEEHPRHSFATLRITLSRHSVFMDNRAQRGRWPLCQLAEKSGLLLLWFPLSVGDNGAISSSPQWSIPCFTLGSSPCQFHLF